MELATIAIYLEINCIDIFIVGESGHGDLMHVIADKKEAIMNLDSYS